MNENAIFKISYGLFFIGTKHEDNASICVVNTVAQITQEPLRISVTMLKDGCTAQLIEKSRHFGVGIMSENAELADIAHFGQQSGHSVNKLEGMEYEQDNDGNPIFSKGCNATLSAKVTQVIDLNTHYLFIADLTEAEVLSNVPAMTYSYYRDKKAGKITKQSEESQAVWQCSICHYVYDGDIPFEDLPDDYLCPVCKQPKSVFKKV